LEELLIEHPNQKEVPKPGKFRPVLSKMGVGTYSNLKYTGTMGKTRNIVLKETVK
jgi:hypothetical protein